MYSDDVQTHSSEPAAREGVLGPWLSRTVGEGFGRALAARILKQPFASERLSLSCFQGPKIEHELFFSNFSGAPGISRQNPGISRQEVWFPWVSKDIPHFLATHPSRGRPLTHPKISGPKSLGLGSFFLPEFFDLKASFLLDIVIPDLADSRQLRALLHGSLEFSLSLQGFILQSRKKRTRPPPKENHLGKEPFWPQRNSFQACGGYKNPIETKKTISATEIFPLRPPFFGKEKFCTGAGRCMPS